ncbi:MAG: hypothetical protein R6U98_36020 [Pirellulaceae bacterium]
MESCPTQAVLPLVGLAADKVIRDRYKRPRRGHRVCSPHLWQLLGNSPPQSRR